MTCLFPAVYTGDGFCVALGRTFSETASPLLFTRESLLEYVHD